MFKSKVYDIIALPLKEIFLICCFEVLGSLTFKAQKRAISLNLLRNTTPNAPDQNKKLGYTSFKYALFVAMVGVGMPPRNFNSLDFS